MMDGFTAGQLLAVTRYGSKLLAEKDPKQYRDLVKGLGVTTTAKGGGGASQDNASQLIVADRKAEWKTSCEDDPQVQYWTRIQADQKAIHGANCAVDDIISREGSEVDVAQYHRGRLQREVLLSRAGLKREGPKLVPVVRTNGDGSQFEEEAQASSSQTEVQKLSLIVEGLAAEMQRANRTHVPFSRETYFGGGGQMGYPQGYPTNFAPRWHGAPPDPAWGPSAHDASFRPQPVKGSGSPPARTGEKEAVGDDGGAGNDREDNPGSSDTGT